MTVRSEIQEFAKHAALRRINVFPKALLLFVLGSIIFLQNKSMIIVFGVTIFLIAIWEVGNLLLGRTKLAFLLIALLGAFAYSWTTGDSNIHGVWLSVKVALFIMLGITCNSVVTDRELRVLIPNTLAPLFFGALAGIQRFGAIVSSVVDARNLRGLRHNYLDFRGLELLFVGLFTGVMVRLARNAEMVDMQYNLRGYGNLTLQNSWGVEWGLSDYLAGVLGIVLLALVFVVR